jgi:hypothetical protein
MAVILQTFTTEPGGQNAEQKDQVLRPAEAKVGKTLSQKQARHGGSYL